MRNILLAVALTTCGFLGAAVYMQATSKMVINTAGLQVVGGQPSEPRELAEGGLDALLRHYAENEDD